MEEVWRDIDGYDGWYQVSNKGRVRSWKGHKGIKRRDNPKILSPGIHMSGYEYVNLCSNGTSTSILVHRLVANEFIEGDDETKTHVLHKDDNPNNNNVKNLKWGDDKDNYIDCLRNGNAPIGENNGHAKLNDEDVLSIRKEYKNNNVTQKNLSIKYGVARSIISRIVNRKIWTHI